MTSDFMDSFTDEERVYFKERMKVIRFNCKCRFMKNKGIYIPFKYRLKWFIQGFLSVYGYRIDYESRLNDARKINYEN